MSHVCVCVCVYIDKSGYSWPRSLSWYQSSTWYVWFLLDILCFDSSDNCVYLATFLVLCSSEFLCIKVAKSSSCVRDHHFTSWCKCERCWWGRRVQLQLAGNLLVWFKAVYILDTKWTRHAAGALRPSPHLSDRGVGSIVQCPHT